MSLFVTQNYFKNNVLYFYLKLSSNQSVFLQGFRLVIALLPEMDGNFIPAGSMKYLSLLYFKQLRSNFIKVLKVAPLSSDWRRPTMQKNNLNNPTTFNVLPQDQDFVLGLLDEAVRQTELPQGLEANILLIKFGQKDPESLPFDDLVDRSLIQKVSIHAAFGVTTPGSDCHLFWARYGLQEVIGSRGSLFTALTMREACNFQTNLDGRPMDLTDDLNALLHFPAKTTFMQMYADTPHNKLDSWRPHPVSGEIVTGGLLHPNTTKAIEKAGLAYIQHMSQLQYKLQGVVKARMEVVSVLSGVEVPDEMEAKQFFNEEKIIHMLKQHALLLPFSEKEIVHNKSAMGVIQDTAVYLVSNLVEVRNRSRNLGVFLDSWIAYQLELALETLFWGKPVCPKDDILATNLVPNCGNKRSPTWQRGFLCLSPPSSACMQGSPPPLNHWVKNDIEQRRVKRMFTFYDCLDSSAPVVGRALIRILLEDLMDTNNISFHLFQQDSPPFGSTKGAISVEQLVGELLKVDNFKYPATFPRAVALLRSKGRDLADVLQNGLASLKLKFFPAFKISVLPTGIGGSRSIWGSKKLIWKNKELWRVHTTGQIGPDATLIETIAGDVCINLQSRGLTYEANIKPCQEFGMPWLEEVVGRLSGENLNHEQMVAVCTFISAIALMNNNRFVHYTELAKLHKQLPITQGRLQQLSILDNTLFAGFRVFNLYRLHMDIPHGLKFPEARKILEWNDAHTQQPEERADPGKEDEVEEENVTLTGIVQLPYNWQKNWLETELQLLTDTFTRDNNVRYCYEKYVKLCKDKGLGVRSYQAYKKKAITMKKAGKI